MTDIHDTADLVSKALRRAWLLGQTYWQQADSEYPSQWKKADVTQATFNQLVEDTRAALTSNSGAQPAPIERSIATKTLSEMFLSLDGRDKAQPGYEWRKGWNAAIRQAMDYAQPVPSVTDGWREGVESAARLIDIKADLHSTRFGHDDMGVLSFGTGTHAEIKMAHYTGLLELAGEVRAMLADAPDGWKLVPIEPTQEMINHVIDERLDALVAGKEHTFIDIYTAMIAAANPGAQTKGEEK